MQYQCQPAGKELAGGRRRGVTMVKKLPPLEVYILQGGSVRRVLIADPRDAFCRTFNKNAKGTGLKATTQPPRRSS
jgi:hypothetical protein